MRRRMRKSGKVQLKKRRWRRVPGKRKGSKQKAKLPGPLQPLSLQARSRIRRRVWRKSKARQKSMS
eukprot:12920912-Prorocentrum_lima.AAC.1